MLVSPVGRSGKVERQDPGQQDPIERAGAADADHAARDPFDVTQVQQIGTDQRPRDARDERDGVAIAGASMIAIAQATAAGIIAGIMIPTPSTGFASL